MRVKIASCFSGNVLLDDGRGRSWKSSVLRRHLGTKLGRGSVLVNLKPTALESHGAKARNVPKIVLPTGVAAQVSSASFFCARQKRLVWASVLICALFVLWLPETVHAVEIQV